MYLDTSGKITFYASDNLLAEISDWFEESEYGSTSMDDEDGSLIVQLESDALSDNKDSIIALMAEVYREFPKIKMAICCGEYDCEAMDKIKRFEARFKDSTLKYRETGWILDEFDDKDYDELVDEGYGDVDEDEYCEHQRRIHDGIDDLQDEFGEWEYIDLESEE